MYFGRRYAAGPIPEFAPVMRITLYFTGSLLTLFKVMLFRHSDAPESVIQDFLS